MDRRNTGCIRQRRPPHQVHLRILSAKSDTLTPDMEISRRALLLSAAAAAESKPIDTHIHLFDPKRFPYHASATYQPPEETLDKYAPFAAGAVSHAIIVHPEPYQDDHR